MLFTYINQIGKRYYGNVNNLRSWTNSPAFLIKRVHLLVNIHNIVYNNICNKKDIENSNKTKRAVKLFKENGFIEKSQRGSHLKMYNPKTKVTTFVPIHSKELKPVLEQAILKESGLK